MPLLTTAEVRPLVISMGDPDGIGPEIITKAWKQREALNLPPFCVVGNADVFAKFAPCKIITDASDAASHFADHLLLFEVNNPQGGLAALVEATRLTVSGAARGLVTAPIAKSRLYPLGFRWPGQTEYVAEQSGVDTEQAVMMLAGPDLRTVPLTIHIPLAEVPKALTADLIIKRARIVAAALRKDFGVEKPRLVIAGLNPHAGENGSIGKEDSTIITPAVATLQAEGMDVRGPLSADTLFHQAARARYDAALCGYHDQALIPIKTLYFDSGVNVTLGLPIVRTSPDHGTAFDIAGQNIASPAAMISAIKLADDISRRRG
jgi:4-hydroxythreonine-4-phosphate dehydrogenase